MDEETKAWEQLGIETLNKLYEKMHDHGWYETERSTLAPLPSGNVGDVCKTCGKIIEPF